MCDLMKTTKQKASRGYQVAHNKADWMEVTPTGFEHKTDAIHGPKCLSKIPLEGHNNSQSGFY